MADDQKDRYIQYLAERTIRKLTIKLNNSLHYGSDAGAEMAVTYHSIIIRNDEASWQFYLELNRNFFKNIFNECRIMLTWCLTKSLWLPTNVKFKTN